MNMTKGPLGGPRPFANDNKRVLVLIGLEKGEPPRDVLISTEVSIEHSINAAAGTVNEYSVTLTTSDLLTDEQKEAVGYKALHAQQFEVTTPNDEITQKRVNAIHNEVVDKINELGYGITGTRTTVI